ncbi:MAG TPA: deoxyribonuclease V [Syntrophobacteria bacterium]|nr:deoxyribonuclease V [Syntrophobacteria bacterium]
MPADAMLHPWDLSLQEAVALQHRLASRVLLRPLPKRIHLIAGADVGYGRDGSRATAAAAVHTLPRLELVELVQVEDHVSFPYVPGLLSFREIPPLLSVFRKLRHQPDAVLCDGQGLAHPRRLGLASHLGLWLNLPTIGCAKTRLVGEHGEPGAYRGQYRSLTYRGERVGVVLRTRPGVKPIYVSPGHLVDFDGCRRLVLRCCRGFRIPEPLRTAHQAVQRAVRA